MAERDGFADQFRAAFPFSYFDPRFLFAPRQARRDSPTMGSYTPEQVSTLFLAIFFLMTAVALSAICIALWRLLSPLIRDRFAAQTAKHTADAKLSESLAVTTVQQATNSAKTNELLEGQGQQIGGIVTTLHRHDSHFKSIAQKIGVNLSAEPHQASVTFTPGVERSSTGTDRPVVVKTEVLHPPEDGG